LDEHGLKTKIVCCDEYPGKARKEWNVLEAMRKDPALNSAVTVVSVHYPSDNGQLTTPPDSLAIGKLLWSSEDQPASNANRIHSRDWKIGGRELAQLYNANYLKGASPRPRSGLPLPPTTISLPLQTQV
jgi:hypothetical protein